MPFSSPVAERLARIYAKNYAPGRTPSPKIDALFNDIVAKRDPALMGRLRQQGTEARIAERSPGVALEAPNLASEAPEAQEVRTSNRYTEALKEFAHEPMGFDAENPATFFRAEPDDTAAETAAGRALDLIPGVSSYVASDLETPETAPKETTLGDDVYGVAKGLTHFVPIAAGLTPVLGPAGGAAVASAAVGGVPTGLTKDDAKEAGHIAIDAATAGVLSKVLKGVRGTSLQEVAKKAGFEGTDEAIAELNRRAGKEVIKDAADAAEKIDPTQVAKALAGQDAPPAIKAFGNVLADRASTIQDTIEATREASKAALEALSTQAKKSAGKALAKTLAADVGAGLAQTTGVAAVEGRKPTAFELGVGGALPLAVHGADALTLRKAGGVGQPDIAMPNPSRAEARAAEVKAAEAKARADAEAEKAAAEAEALSEAQGALAPVAKRGDASRVLIAGEERKPTKVTYVAVPLDKIVPSHDPISFEKNPAHGIGNTRDYGNSQSLKLGVMTDAQNLDPGILLSTGEYNQDGPPVVDSSGNVLGGNGRTMKMMRAMRQYPEKWNAYIAELRKRAGEFGLKPEDIGDGDVLVRMVPHETTKARKEALVQKFNEPASNAPTLAEEAQGYANLLSEADVAAIKVNDGETFRQAIARHGEEWLGQWAKSNKIPRTQIGRLIDPTTGKLSADGKRLLENVVLGKLVGDKTTFDLVADDPPLRDALSRAAGPLIELANLENQGRIKGGGVLKALPKVLKWVTTAAEGKVKGGQQGDLVAPTFTKREQTLVDLFVKGRENPKAFGDAIRDTVAEIRGKAPKAKDEQDLLAGDQPTLPDAGAYLDALSRRFTTTAPEAPPEAPKPATPVSKPEVSRGTVPTTEATPDAPLETPAADAVPADVPPEVPVAASPEGVPVADAGGDAGVVPEHAVATAQPPVGRPLATIHGNGMPLVIDANTPASILREVRDRLDNRIENMKAGAIVREADIAAGKSTSAPGGVQRSAFESAAADLAIVNEEIARRKAAQPTVAAEEATALAPEPDLFGGDESHGVRELTSYADGKEKPYSLFVPRDADYIDGDRVSDVKSVLERVLEKTDQDNPLHALTERLLEYGKSVEEFGKYKVKFLKKSDMKGSWTPSRGEIVVRHDVRDARYVFLHEAVHAATTSALSLGKAAATNEPLRNLYGAEMEFSNSIEKLYREVKDYVRENDLDSQYGLANSAEFVSEAFTNEDFQILLSKVHTTPNTGRPTSLLSRFIKAVRRVIGLPEKVNGKDYDTVLEEVILATNKMWERVEERTAKESRGDYSSSYKAADKDASGGSEGYTRALEITIKGAKNAEKALDDLADADALRGAAEELDARVDRNARREPYVPQAEKANVARGKEAIINRLRLEVSKEVSEAKCAGQPLDEVALANEVKAVEKFIDLFDRELIDDVALSVRSKGPKSTTAQGLYDFASSIVTIFKNNAIREGGFGRTAIHEIWHALSRVLPEEHFDAIIKQYRKERDAYIAKNRWFAWFTERDSLTPNEYELYKQENPGKELFKGEDGKYRVHYDGENYRFKNVDEWFAETLSDRSQKRMAQLDENAKSLLLHTRNVILNMYEAVRQALGLDVAGKMFEKYVKGEFTHRVGERFGPIEPRQLFDREKEIMRTWREQRIGEAKGEDIFQADVRTTLDDLDQSLRDVSGRGLPEEARKAAEARAKEYAETDRHVRDFIDKHGADAFAERGAEAIQRTVDAAVAAGEAPKALSAAVAAMVRRNPARYARLALAFVDPTVARRGAYAEKQNLIILAARATARGGLRAGVEELYHGIAKTLSGSDRATALAQHAKAVGERLVEVRKMQQDLMRAGATAEQVRELGAEAKWLEDALAGKASPADAPDGWYHLSDPDEFFANTLTDIELQRYGASYLDEDHGTLRGAAAKAKLFLQDLWESMKGVVGAEDKMLALWKRLEDPAHTVADGGRMLRHEAWLRSPENFERWLATADEGDVAQAAPPRAAVTPEQEAAERRIFPSMGPQVHVPIKQRVSEFWKDFRRNGMYKFVKNVFNRNLVALESKRKFHRTAETSAWDAINKTRHTGQIMSAIMQKGKMGALPEWDAVNNQIAPKQGTEGIGAKLQEIEDAGLWDHTWAYMAGTKVKAYEAMGRATGISPADADHLVALADTYPKIKEYAQVFETVKESILDIAEATGVVGKVGREGWQKPPADFFGETVGPEGQIISREEAEKGFYVPFVRVIEGAEGGLHDVLGPMEKGGVFDQVSGIKRLKGSKSPIGDPFENWTKMMWHLLDASLKNHAARTVIKELQDIQTLTGETMVRRLQQRQHGTNAVGVLRDGFREYYDIQDPEWYEAVRSMGPKKYGSLMRALIGARHLLSSMVTKSPGFIPVNAIRDSVHYSMISDGHPFEPAARYLRAFRGDPVKLKLVMAGSASGGFFVSSPKNFARDVRGSLKQKSAFGKLINSPIAAWRFLERVGEATETGTRMAMWENQKAKGASDAKAAGEALDVINYAHEGSHELLGNFLDTVPFLRARMAGLYKEGRSATDPAIRKTFWQRGAMLTASTLALAYWNKKYNAEQYDALEEFDKDSNWHFFLPGDTHVRVPKPFEAGLFFATLPERAMGPFGFIDPSSPDAGDWDLAADRMMSALSQTLEVNPYPQLINPLIEQKANKSLFTGRPIVPVHQQNLEPELQYDDRTSNTAMRIASVVPDLSVIGMEGARSPARIEAIARGYFGSMASYFFSTADLLMSPWQDLRPGYRSPLDLTIGRLVETTSDARATRYIGQFYDLANEARKAQLTLQTYAKKRDFEAARRYAEENAPILSLAESIGDVEKALGSLSQGMAAVRVDEGMTREEREQRLQELGGRRNMIARDFTRKLREIQEAQRAQKVGAP